MKAASQSPGCSHINFRQFVSSASSMPSINSVRHETDSAPQRVRSAELLEVLHESTWPDHLTLCSAFFQQSSQPPVSELAKLMQLILDTVAADIVLDSQTPMGQSLELESARLPPPRRKATKRSHGSSNCSSSRARKFRRDLRSTVPGDVAVVT
jgi:hypothetical protein